MVRSAVAFCPGHISGYFRRVHGKSVAATGSVGAGIVINEGVTATVVPSAVPGVLMRRRAPDGRLLEERAGSPPVEYVIAAMGENAAVTTECRLPIGAGFGLSAAALLATITALDALFGRGMRRSEIAALAHEAEIVHHTGLGDVAACQEGGLVCRKGPGIDAEIIRDFAVAGPLRAVNFGPLETSEVITSPGIMERVEQAFPSRCPDSIEDFFAISRKFAEDSGLVTPAVATVLADCAREGVPASMTMLGNGVFAYGPRAGAVLGRYGEVIPLAVEREGVRLIGVTDDS